MTTSKAQIRASMKYEKENKVQIKLTVNKKTEAELLVWIESQDNKQGYIKSLIHADMNKQKG